MGKFSLLLLHVFKSAILGNVGTHRLKLHAVSDIETLMVTSHIVPILLFKILFKMSHSLRMDLYKVIRL